jgi:hypothetical protein
MLTKDSKAIQIKLDVTELNPQQVRLIKTVNTLLVQMLSAPDEAEFFDGSAEFMKAAANAIKQSNFVDNAKGMTNINFADQALEFAIDNLQENMQNNKIINFDN